MALISSVQTFLDGLQMFQRFLGMPCADLDHARRWFGAECFPLELPNFTSAVSFNSGKVRAGDARVIHDADFRRVCREANELTVFPGLYIGPANAEAGVDTLCALLPRAFIHDFDAAVDLLQLIIEFNAHQSSHSIGRVHFTHGTQTPAADRFTLLASARFRAPL